MTTYSAGNPFTQKGAPATTKPDEVTDTVVETMTPAQYVTKARELAAGLIEAYREADTLDEAVEYVRAMKEAYGVLYSFLGDARGDLWENYGTGKHATETGRTFTFTAPTGSRSCNYTDLEAIYPEAYEACVTKKAPKADAVGSLRLPKGGLK